MVLKTLSHRALGEIAAITGVISICLLTLPYYLFPQFYTPKVNAALGYVSPASVEGWAFLAIGVLLLCFTVVLLVRFKAKKS